MFRALVALLRIAKEVRRIRQILETVHYKELAAERVYKHYKPLKSSEVIIDTDYIQKTDLYGKIIEEDAENEQFVG